MTLNILAQKKNPSLMTTIGDFHVKCKAGTVKIKRVSECKTIESITSQFGLYQW